MDDNVDIKLPYEVPITFKYKVSEKRLMALFFVILIFISLSYLGLIAEDYTMMMVGILIIVLLLAITFGFYRSYLEISGDYIKIKFSYISKTVRWDEVVSIVLNANNDKNLIGIITKKKLLRQKKNRVLNDLLYSPYEILIQLDFLQQMDVERLFMTIEDKMNCDEINEFLQREGFLVDDKKETNQLEEKTSSIYKAYLMCFMWAVIIGLLYGFLSSILSGDLYLITFAVIYLGTYKIIGIYHKNYNEQSFNIFKRLIVGLICTLPLIIGILSEDFFHAKVLPNRDTFMIVRNKIWTLKNDEALFIMILFGIGVLLYYGTFHGKTFKIQYKIYKLIGLYKRYGDYYCNKDGALFNIYLVDPQELNYEYMDIDVLHIEKGCLVEKDKKRPGGLYIPLENLKESNNISWKQRHVFIEGKQYLYFDLGNPDKCLPKEYQLPLVIYLDKDKNMITIQMSYYREK
ncbi:hypothetical protein [Vallitalea okinawensis]|uniref:hypothetical protein n=1 Tax=Vallitalea okinawensis TaxID=2078660 RepID=UPI000CFDCFD4|nr:hypothetical protein [Vallitalea okinawensis]